MIDKKEITSQFIEATYYNGSDLGANYTVTSTTFRLWSPTAKKVTLFLFDKGYKSKPYDKIKMVEDQNGTWLCEVTEDLHGVYYTYEVEFTDMKNELVDPYARACGVNGERGMIMDMARVNPENWDQDDKPELLNFTDAIIYEGHIRDLTIHKTSGATHNGKFLAMGEPGTRSSEGLATGLDHLVELGVTHLQLLPVFDFEGIDESKLSQPQYNWGYHPSNFFCLEGSYSTNPIDGETRIKEFKMMVQSLHQHGIRVVLDLVFNRPDRIEESNVAKSFPGYYYRDQVAKSGHDGVGYEIASERPMVRKYIVDCVTYLAKEYHVDGFRFDTMVLMDIETMNAIRDALDLVDPSILIYGEGWTSNKSQLPTNQKASKNNLDKLPRIAIYCDESRDGLKGPTLYPNQPGFVNGAVEMEDTVKFTVVAATSHPQIDYENVIYSKKPWSIQPHQTINYASYHLDFTIFDKIIETTETLDMDTRIKMSMMTNAIILTSQGIPLIQAGEEMLRTKSGDNHSYKSPDMINQIVWNSKYDHQEIFDYYKGLIALRKAHPAFRMTTTEMIQNHLNFFESPVSNTLYYHLSNHANGDDYTDIVVIFNANTSEVKFKLPHFGNWNIVVEKDKAGTEILRRVLGSEIVIPELTTMVLYSNEKMVNEVTVVDQGRDTNMKKVTGIAVGAIGLYLLLKRRRRK